MTEPDDRYSEEMRRALSAAADLVVPAGDGLAKIRERVVHRPTLFAWFAAYTQDLPHRIFVFFRVAATGLTSIGSGGLAGAATEPPDGRRRPHFNRESSWVRPTLAAMGALAIVAIAATLILPRLTEPVSQSALSNGQTGQNSGAASGNPGSSSSRQNSSGGLPFPSRTSRSTITTLPSPTECEPLPPPITSTASPSPSPTDTTPTADITPTPAPGPTETVTPVPAPAPENFTYIIGEVPPPASPQQAVASATCTTESSTSAPPSVPPTSSSPTSSPPASSPPPSSSPPPTTSPPPSSPPPTSTPPSLPSPQGTVSPAQPPLSR